MLSTTTVSAESTGMPATTSDIPGKGVKPLVAQALYDNVPDWPDELAFQRGDLLHMYGEYSDESGVVPGWWLCVDRRGREGIAPATRLRLLPDKPEHPSAKKEPSPPHPADPTPSNVQLRSNSRNARRKQLTTDATRQMFESIYGEPPPPNLSQSSPKRVLIVPLYNDDASPTAAAPPPVAAPSMTRKPRSNTPVPFYGLNPTTPLVDPAVQTNDERPLSVASISSTDSDYTSIFEGPKLSLDRANAEKVLEHFLSNLQTSAEKLVMTVRVTRQPLERDRIGQIRQIGNQTIASLDIFLNFAVGAYLLVSDAQKDITKQLAQLMRPLRKSAEMMRGAQQNFDRNTTDTIVRMVAIAETLPDDARQIYIYVRGLLLSSTVASAPSSVISTGVDSVDSSVLAPPSPPKSLSTMNGHIVNGGPSLLTGAAQLNGGPPLMTAGTQMNGGQVSPGTMSSALTRIVDIKLEDEDDEYDFVENVNGASTASTASPSVMTSSTGSSSYSNPSPLSAIERQRIRSYADELNVKTGNLIEELDRYLYSYESIQKSNDAVHCESIVRAVHALLSTVDSISRYVTNTAFLQRLKASASDLCSATQTSVVHACRNAEQTVEAVRERIELLLAVGDKARGLCAFVQDSAGTPSPVKTLVMNTAKKQTFKT